MIDDKDLFAKLDLTDPKDLKWLKYRRNRDASVGAVHQIAKANGKKTYIRVSRNTVIECELYDELAIGSNGKIPPELHAKCPSCGNDLSGFEKKGLRVSYFPPRRLSLPDGRVVVETCVVSIDGLVRCGHDANNGKGVCGWTARIEDGVVR